MFSMLLTKLPRQMVWKNRWMHWFGHEDIMRSKTLYSAICFHPLKRVQACTRAGLAAVLPMATSDSYKWEEVGHDGYLRSAKWVKVIFCGIWVQWLSTSFFILTLMGRKRKKPPQHFQDPAERKGKETGKRNRTTFVAQNKTYPSLCSTKAGSRPLNQRRSVEGAPIKQIFKEGFIHNTSCCYFLPTSGVIDFLQVISPHCFGSLYSAFCCWAPRRFCLFEILLKPAENLTEPFILPPRHWCDVWPNVVYRWICVTSPCERGASKQKKWNLLW